MKRLLLALLSIAIALASSAFTPRARAQAYYISKPSRQFASDSTADGAMVYWDVRTVVWLNSGLYRLRRELQEGGVCLHIAAAMPPDGFKVDSIAQALPVESDTSTTTWWQTNFRCPTDGHWAPLHFHIIVPELRAWFEAVEITTSYLDAQCAVSVPDRNPQWSKYPFNAMMCGFGTDSIIAYRVRNR